MKSKIYSLEELAEKEIVPTVCIGSNFADGIFYLKFTTCISIFAVPLTDGDDFLPFQGGYLTDKDLLTLRSNINEYFNMKERINET